ncbi:hypothetical protein F6X77_12385, partial [Enterococcus faecium]
GSCNVLLGMFLWLKTLYRKRAVTWPFIFYTIIWTLSRVASHNCRLKKFLIHLFIWSPPVFNRLKIQK